MSARKEAIEALLIEASSDGFTHFSEYCEAFYSEMLGYDAWYAVAELCPCATHEEIALEAARLLIEGWVTGQKVVLL